MQVKEIDILAMSEMNVNWRVVGKSNTVNDITRGLFENHRINTACNQNDKSCHKYQPGGTCILSRGEAALRVIKTGQDERKLGRWAWQLFLGKDNIRMRIYFPNISKSLGHKKVTHNNIKRCYR